jgi:itaconyl-CoA hydratase
MTNGPRRGPAFEDFRVGDVIRSRIGRTISEADNVWFTCLTMNTNQIHFNHEYAKRSEFGRPLVVSTLTIAIAIGQSVADTTQNAFANLGLDKLVLTAPMFVGDTMWSESVVLDKRESASRPHAGVVTIRTRSLNQDGVDVLSFERTFYVYRAGAEQVSNVFPTARNPMSTTR